MWILLKERSDDDDLTFDENRGGCFYYYYYYGCSKKFKKIIIATSFLRPKVFESERFFDEHEFRRVRTRRVRGEFW